MMRHLLQPIELMILCLAGMLTERERLIRLYQQEEILFLHEQLGNRPPLATETESDPAKEVHCHERLGGLLRSYHRRAA